MIFVIIHRRWLRVLVIEDCLSSRVVCGDLRIQVRKKRLHCQRPMCWSISLKMGRGFVWARWERNRGLNSILEWRRVCFGRVRVCWGIWSGVWWREWRSLVQNRKLRGIYFEARRAVLLGLLFWCTEVISIIMQFLKLYHISPTISFKFYLSYIDIMERDIVKYNHEHTFCVWLIIFLRFMSIADD